MSGAGREALANWWLTFDGPAYPTGYEFADAILASEWLAQVKATARAEALREAAIDGPLHFAMTHTGRDARGWNVVEPTWLNDRADAIDGGAR